MLQSYKFFGADTLEKGAPPVLKISKLSDVVKQIVYIGLIDPAVIVILALFVTNYENFSKSTRSNCWPNKPLRLNKSACPTPTHLLTTLFILTHIIIKKFSYSLNEHRLRFLMCISLIFVNLFHCKRTLPIRCLRCGAISRPDLRATCFSASCADSLTLLS